MKSTAPPTLAKFLRMDHDRSILVWTERRGPLVCTHSPHSQILIEQLLIVDTDVDYATRLISLSDDPSLPVWTFRMWFLSICLSCFGAVLGQIFVSKSCMMDLVEYSFFDSIFAHSQFQSVNPSSRYALHLRNQ